MRSCVFASILSIAGASAPATGEFASTARWMVENLDWGYLTTTSTRSKSGSVGDPFGNPYAFADVAGVPYFYASGMDASIVDINAGNSRVSLGMSESQFIGTSDEVAACKIGTPYGDPENPPCARLVLSGVWRQLAKHSDEESVAKTALFAKHPSFPLEPHDFFAAALDVDSVWILDMYGGIPDVTPSDYFAASSNASAAHMIRQTQHEQQHLGVSRKRPNPLSQVSTARWMVETLTWGSLATVSTRSEGSVVGDPFANPYSFAGGPNGELYFFASDMDASMIDLAANTRATFALSEASLTGTNDTVKACVVGESTFGDPENPPCARLVFAGNWAQLDTSTTEGATAQAALFAAHPSFARYPSGHDFFVATLDIDGIWFIDKYGGANHMKVSKYLGWSAAADVVVV